MPGHTLAQVSQVTSAWRLRLSAWHTIAVGSHQVVEYLTDVEAMSVPLARRYCRHVIAWRGQWVPLVVLEPSDESVMTCTEQGVKMAKKVMVVSCQSSVNNPSDISGGSEGGQADLQYIAFAVSDVTKIPVDDASMCEPDDSLAKMWGMALRSSFEYQGEIIAVVSLMNIDQALADSTESVGC